MRILLIILSLALNVEGKTYFLTAADKFTSITPLPGDSVLLERGAMWREQFTVPCDNLYIGAYLRTVLIAKPIINAADVITSWTSVGSNKWYTINPNPVKSRTVVVVNAQIQTQVSSLAEVVQGTCYLDQSTFRVYLFSTSAPVGVEVAAREYGIVTSGVNVRKNITVEDIQAQYAGRAGFYFEGRGVAFNGSSVLRRIYAYGNRLIGVAHYDHYDNLTIEDSRATHNGNGFYSWIADGGTFRRDTTSDQSTNIFDAALNKTDGHAFGGYQSKNWLVEHCVSNRDYDAIHIDCGGVSLKAVIQRNKVFDSRAGSPNTPTMGIGSLGTGGEILICYNLLVNGSSAGFETYTDQLGTVKFFNNTVYNNAATATTYGNVSLFRSGTNFIFKNNLFVKEYVANRYNYYISLPQIPTSDYNLFYILNSPSEKMRMYYNGASYSTLTAWQATGQDLHSISADPLFKDVNGDWSLQNGSSAINKGVDVGLTKDIDGKLIEGLPDIGAYEFLNALPLIDRTRLRRVIDAVSTFSVYPNPATTTLNIQLAEPSTVRMTSVVGRQLYNQFIFQTTKINVSKFSPGLYVLEIISRDKTIVTKIIKL